MAYFWSGVYWGYAAEQVWFLAILSLEEGRYKMVLFDLEQGYYFPFFSRILAVIYKLKHLLNHNTFKQLVPPKHAKCLVFHIFHPHFILELENKIFFIVASSSEQGLVL